MLVFNVLNKHLSFEDLFFLFFSHIGEGVKPLSVSQVIEICRKLCGYNDVLLKHRIKTEVCKNFKIIGFSYG